jgi:hypothetical protein
MKLRYYILFIVVAFVGKQASAQFHTGKSKSELGFMVGGTYYIGDMNPFMPFRNTNLAGGLIYRYNVNARMSVRANFLYGKLHGNDAESKELLHQERNLSFSTRIFELAGGLEFNYFPFQLGHDRYKGTAYILAEIGLFRMNPKTTADGGGEVELQPLGTEGQGTSLNSKGRYSLTQLTIPLGVGAKMSLGEKASLNFEIGLRKTFTDYIDDVGSGSYVDPVVLAAENGPTAAALSNRSLSGDRYGRRGNASTKDWYVFAGAMVTFRLGQPATCYGFGGRSRKK